MGKDKNDIVYGIQLCYILFYFLHLAYDYYLVYYHLVHMTIVSFTSPPMHMTISA